MIRRILACALAMVAAGCATEVQRTPVTDGPAPIQRQPSFMTHVQVQATPLGEIANSGVQLPVVSPDGRWIAYLQLSGAPVDPRAPLTGEGAERLSLVIQSVQADAPQRVLCPAGALWPAFSADSRYLVWIVYNRGRCDIALCDLQTRAIRRVSTGLKHMMMPAVSPSGDRVAVVADGPGPGRRRMHVVQMATTQVVDCPADEATVGQYSPQWTPDGRIVYLLQHTDGTFVAQWGPGEFDPETLAAIPMESSEDAAYLAAASIGRPLSPDGRRFAWLDASGPTLNVIDLQSQQLRRLPDSYVAGCWFDRRYFIAANTEKMSLFSDDADKPPALVMRGLWIPLTAVDGNVIAVTRGSHRGAFALVRLKVTPGE